MRRWLRRATDGHVEWLCRCGVDRAHLLDVEVLAHLEPQRTHLADAVAALAQRRDQIEDYIAAIRRLSKGCGRSTIQAACSFSAKLQRAGGWERLGIDQQIDAIVKARAFASWLMVTGQLTVSASILGRVDLRLGNAAGNHCPDARRWFIDACALLCRWAPSLLC